MLTLDCGLYCTREESYEYTGDLPYQAGREGFLCVVLVEEGSCGLPLPDDCPVLPAGSLLVTAAPVEIQPLDSLRMMGVLLGGGAARDMAQGMEEPHILDPVSARGASQWVQRLCKNNLTPWQASAAGYSLLCELAGAEPRVLPVLVEAAIAEMREHFDEVYGIEELAAQLSVSKSYLIRCFTAATGISPGRYLVWVRLEAAKNYLAVQDLDLETVAVLCGFSGANYFCRVFKKEMGLTPGQWRNLHRADHPDPVSREKLDSMYL